MTATKKIAWGGLWTDYTQKLEPLWKPCGGSLTVPVDADSGAELRKLFYSMPLEVRPHHVVATAEWPDGTLAKVTNA